MTILSQPIFPDFAKGLKWRSIKTKLLLEMSTSSYKLQVFYLSDAQNDTGSDWALKFLGQGTAQQPTIT